jgi:hypothetical protein
MWRLRILGLPIARRGGYKDHVDIGWPANLTFYKLLTDWGSLIGGVFALTAGVIA